MYLNKTSNFIFLGGSCNPTTWRSEIAIPLLKNYNTKYFNPQVSRWRPELIEIENEAKQIANVLFFVLDNQTRSIATMIELSEISATNRKLICVLKEFFLSNTVICNEQISYNELNDLKQAQCIIKSLFKSQGIPVFKDIKSGLINAIHWTKKDYSTDELILDLKEHYFTRYSKLSEKTIQLKNIFRSFDICNLNRINLIDVDYIYNLITNLNLTDEILNSITFCQLKIKNDHVNNENNLNFEQFCYLFSIYDYTMKQKKTDINFDINDHKNVNDSKIRQNKLKNSLDILNKTCLSRLNIFVREISNFFFKFLFNNNYKNSMHNINSHKNKNKNVDFTPSYFTNSQMYNYKPIYPFKKEFRDVYLGGTSSTFKWREKIAIPFLKKHHLTFYYQFENFYDVKINSYEKNAILNSKILLFVITSNSRSLSSMLMAAHCIAKEYCVVLCIEYLKENCLINGEIISEIARKDYNRGRDYLLNIAKRYKKPVYTNIIDSLQAVFHLSNLL